MDLERGYHVEQPDVLIPWGISEDDLQDLVPPTLLRHVTTGYWVFNCTSLNGFEHVLGLHFSDDKLWEFEFFLDEPHDPDRQYPLWQQHLEATFGSPTQTAPGSEGFPDQLWLLGSARVHHYVFERFTLEEHVGIVHRHRKY